MTQPEADEGTGPRQPVPFISRVRLKNYKSIADCDVRLGPLTLLVGPNGSGKSNFLDALAFLARALATTPAEAIDERGGLNEILRRAPDQADSFSMTVEATVPWGEGKGQSRQTSYEFEIGAPSRRGLRSFEIKRERGFLRDDVQNWMFIALHGAVKRSWGSDAVIGADRMYLPTAGAGFVFASLFNALRSMQFYSFALDVLRTPHVAGGADVLLRNGGKLGEILEVLKAYHPEWKRRIDAYLRAISPDIIGVDPYAVASYMTIALRAATGADGGQVEFSASGASDGTMHAIAVLAALFQPFVLTGRLPLVGIEEPELGLHPGAAEVLFDALTEASGHVQVLATTQSADLLDRRDLDMSSVRAVSMVNGITVIGEIDDINKRVVQENLFTVGELMRASQISPQPSAGDDVTSKAP